MKRNLLYSPLRKARAILLVMLGLVFLVPATGFCQIIPANRRTIWQDNVGVPGGIPTRQTVFVTFPSGTAESDIQKAIYACPSNEVVLLGPGYFNLTTTLNMNVKGVTLRGSGPGVTFVTNNNIYVGDINWYNEWIKPNRARHVNWTNGFAQGANTVMVDNTGDLQVGELIFLDVLNDTNVDYVGACKGPVGQEYTSMANPNTGQDRLQFQLNRVTAINGHTLTLSDPLYMPNYQAGYGAGLDPQVWWYGTQPGAMMSGIEDLTFIGQGGSSAGIWLMDAYACWIKDVSVTSCRYYFSTMVAQRCEIRHCIAYGPPSSVDDYAYYIQKASGLLMEDNISSNAVTGILIVGAQGCVFSYNFITNCSPPGSSWMDGGIYTHGGHPNMNLFEGNVAPMWEIQNCWGSSVYNTAFRNRFTGQDPPNMRFLAGDIQAININAMNRFMNVVGNVLGTTGANTWYEDSGTSYDCHQTGRVYAIGESSGGCSTGFDPTTYNSLLRAVNWTSATATNNGIVLDGYSTNDLPPSYYLSSKPGYFGNLAWPPIDPSNPGYSSSMTNIPAGYRLAYGTPPPGVVTQPPPPQGLHRVK